MVTYVDAATAPLKNTGQIRLYGPEDFEAMRKACQVTAKCLDELANIVKPGVTTQEIDTFVYDFGEAHNAVSASFNYRGFTKFSCTSINHVVCHGITNDKPLREGDIVNVDVTYVVDGWYGDSSRMYPVGAINRKAERLLEVTYKSLMLGIEAAKPGNTTGDIGHAIQSYVESNRFSVVRDFCGHGVGQLFHDTPNILHYGRPGEGIELKPGMIFTIEPMVNTGRPQVKILSDGWTAVTRDRSLSGQYEHTIGITPEGCEIFTLSPGGLHTPGLVLE